MNIRLATRGSALALWQANRVAELIRSHSAGAQVELIVVSTSPDRRPDVSLVQLGGDKGLFTAELEQAIRDGRADAAVHSCKDLPGEIPPDMQIAAFPERADVRDSLISRNHQSLEQLPAGAHVGTSALRRRGQLLRIRPDLQISEIRGNVDTRIRKLQDGLYDAIVLASAGIHRLELEQHITQRLPVDLMFPAAGQGAIGVEAPINSDFSGLWRELDDPTVRVCVEAERELVRELGADCRSAAGCLCEAVGDLVNLRATVITPDGTRQLIHRDSGQLCTASELAATAARELLARGAGDILRA